MSFLTLILYNIEKIHYINLKYVTEWKYIALECEMYFVLNICHQKLYKREFYRVFRFLRGSQMWTNLSLNHDRIFLSDDDRKLAACVPSEKLFLDRRAWERQTGVESYGTSHVSYANSRHPEITPVHQTERGVHDWGLAPAIARWRCNELIISARQSREYKRRGRRMRVSESTGELISVICVFPWPQGSSDCNCSFVTLVSFALTRASLICSAVLRQLYNFDERILYLWDFQNSYRVLIQKDIIL